MSVALINRQETLDSMFPGPALGRLTNAITGAVHRSFQDPNGQLKREITRAEIKDRFSACIKWVRILRGDQQWGLERIIGQLDEIIRCHLAKMEYKIPTRSLWMPEDGS